MLNRVLLPAPLGPISPVIRPVSTAKLTLLSTRSPLKLRETCLTSSRAGIASAPCTARKQALCEPPQCASKALGQKNHREDQAGGKQHCMDIAELGQHARHDGDEQRAEHRTDH